MIKSSWSAGSPSTSHTAAPQTRAPDSLASAKQEPAAAEIRLSKIPLGQLRAGQRTGRQVGAVQVGSRQIGTQQVAVGDPCTSGVRVAQTRDGVKPRQHQLLGVDDATVRCLVLDPQGPRRTPVEVLAKIRVRSFCTGDAVCTAGEDELRNRCCFRDRSMISRPSGLWPGWVATTARTRSGAYAANRPTRDPVPEKPSRINLADASSRWPDNSANCPSAARRARPIPCFGSEAPWSWRFCKVRLGNRSATARAGRDWRH